MDAGDRGWSKGETLRDRRPVARDRQVADEEADGGV